jgi:hypothetical protein
MANHLAEMERLDKAFYVDAAEAAGRLLTPAMEAQCVAEVKASYSPGVEFATPLKFVPEVAKLVRPQINRYKDRNTRSVEPPAAFVTTCMDKGTVKGPCGCYYEVRLQLTKLVFIRRLQADDFYETISIPVTMIRRR